MKFKMNIEDYLKKITAEDGTIDYSKGNELVEEDVLKFNSKNAPDMEQLKKDAYDQAQDDFIKGLKIDGVETVDTFKQHLNKLGSEDKAQEVIRLTNEMEALNTKYGTLENEYNSLNQESAALKNEKFLISKGATPEDVDYLSFKIGKLVSDEVPFETAYETFAKENNKYFKPQAPVVTVNSGTERTSTVNNDDKFGFEIELEKKGKL